MSAAIDGRALLAAVRAALATPEGRALAREIALELARADEEARVRDPIAADVDVAFSRARRADRRRAK